MSDGLARVSGAPVTVKTPDGKTWIVSGLTLKDFGTIEQHLLSMRPSPLDEILPRLNQITNVEVQKYLCDKAVEAVEKNRQRYNTVPVSEVTEWGQTVSGSIYAGWLSLRKEHPGITMDEAADVIQKIGMEKFQEALNQASGIDKLGNSTGLPSTPPARQKEGERTGGPSGSTSESIETSSQPRSAN